jgi:hypothetical protein
MRQKRAITLVVALFCVQLRTVVPILYSAFVLFGPGVDCNFDQSSVKAPALDGLFEAGA